MSASAREIRKPKRQTSNKYRGGSISPDHFEGTLGNCSRNETRIGFEIFMKSAFNETTGRRFFAGRSNTSAEKKHRDKVPSMLISVQLFPNDPRGSMLVLTQESEGSMGSKEKFENQAKTAVNLKICCFANFY